MALIWRQKKVVQEIISAHSSDDNLDVDKTALLRMAQDILCHEFSTLDRGLITDSNVLEPQQGITEKLAFTIHKIGCELSCNCSSGGDMKSITLAVFENLVKYSWEDKLVLVLSAFAVSYGEFRLLMQPPNPNPLANYVGQLKPLPEMSELENLIGPLLKVVICVTNTIIELNGLSSQYNSHDKPPCSDDEISIIAVYWGVRAIVACSTQSIAFMNQQNMVSIIEASEKMITLTGRLTTIHEKLKTTSEEKKIEEGCYRIQRIIRSIHTDNMEILSELIQTKDGNALFNGATEEEARLEVLKSKTVMLFISYLDISEEKVKEIEQWVCKADGQYETVWLPICDKTITTMETDKIEMTIRTKASQMKCHSLHYSATLQSYVIQYIKREWLLQKKQVMVVLNPCGKVVNSNAYQMIMTWGSEAYPFHAHIEETLWRKWSIERFLIEGVVSEKKQWVKEKRVIYLYGGDDLDWIRKFIKKTKEVVEREEISLELIYVGKKHTETIENERLATEVWEEQKIRQFYARLDQIYQSKTKLGKSITDDKTVKHFKTLLDAGDDGQGWTIIGQGSNDMAVILDKHVAIESLVHLEKKKGEITKESFISTLHGAIKIAKRSLKSQESNGVHNHCNHIYVPTKNMVCVDCQRPIEQESKYHIQVMHQKSSNSSHSESVAAGMSYSSRFASK